MPKILNEKDAILIWIIRWLRQLSTNNSKYSNVAIQAKFGELDARRLYELWEGQVFPNSHKKALSLFSKVFPMHVAYIDTSYHVPRNTIVRIISNKDQPDLFDNAA